MSLCYLLRLELAEPRRLVLAQRGEAELLGHRERILEHGERARAGRHLECLDGLRLGLENRLSERQTWWVRGSVAGTRNMFAE